MKNHPLIWLAVAVAVALTAYSSFYTVDQSERSLRLRFGEVVQADAAPGLHVKIPFAESVLKFDGRLLAADNQDQDFLTADKKNVQVAYYAEWRIVDTRAFYRATGGQQLVATDRLSAIINGSLRGQFAGMTLQQAVTGDNTAVLASVPGDRLKELGIAVVDVRIKRIDLAKDVADSVYDRMRAERTRIASELRAQGAEAAEKIRADADQQAQVVLADAYRDAQKLRGEGDAKAAEIYAKAYGQDPEFYSFYRSLNIYRSAFGSKQDVLVLEPKGEFFRYFKSSGGK